MFENLPDILKHFFFIIPAIYMALFHVVNPIGSGVLFLNLTHEANNVIRRRLARKVAINSLIILCVTLLIGVYILKLFGITIPIVQICGGAMILNMGWRSVNYDDSVNESDKKKSLASGMEEHSYDSQTFYPYTFPFTIGPGSIAVTLTISAEYITNSPGNDLLQYVACLISVILICITIFICYSSADYLMGKISEQVRRVIMKILSFVLLCIGGQIITNGVIEFLKQLRHSGIIGN
jgi:multiple antibiotic resistance protein